MPTFDFGCPNGHKHEEFFKTITKIPRTRKCPTCGKRAKRLIGAGAGFIFKGPGFYCTDYPKTGKPKA